ncbi:MAG: otsB [Herminiimonas sp.]|nr:otsB [Herminiimonas sp.]MDB5854623.1 otsB [Herminiimonas sp.]
MISLFSPEGIRRLDQIVQPGLLCVFDFDGTLSAIVPEPDRAHLTPEVYESLVKLSALTPVAILTGRSLEDIRPRLRFEPAYLVGNHGLEGVPGCEESSAQYLTLCRRWEHAIRTALHDDGFDPRVWVENKGYSLSVHYRDTPDPHQTEGRLEHLFSQVAPEARVIAGKSVFSLLPPNAADKGSALQQLMRISAAPCVIYVGDDVTDEDVFRLQRPDLLSIRIEPATHSAAACYLPQWQDVIVLLDDLISRLSNADPHQLRNTASNVGG